MATDQGLIVLPDDIIMEAESAKESGLRPKFRNLLDRIIAGELDGIIAWHSNRLSRNMLEAGEIIDLLDRDIIKDLKFASHTFTNDPSGKILLGIVFVMAKQFSDQLSVGINRGIEKSLAAGAYVNTPKHGYIKDHNKKLRPDGNNWNIVKESFHMRLNGDTLEKICEYMQTAGYYGRGKENIERKIKIKPSTLGSIFSDPVYAGVLQYGKEIIDLTELYDFVPVVTVEEYLKLNKFTSLEKAFKVRRSTRSKEKRVADFLPQHVYCASCGELTQCGISTGKTKKYYMFRCMTPGCERQNKSTRAKVIVDFVVDFLEQKPFVSKEAYQSYKKEIVRLQNEGLSSLNSQIASNQTKINIISEDIMQVESNFSKETDHEIKTTQKSRLKQLKQDLLQTKTILVELKDKKSKVNQAPASFEEFVEIMEEIPDKIKKVRGTKGKDAYIAPVFSNFSVSSKCVEKYTLNQPFGSLISDNFPGCGDGGNRVTSY